jgi:hypothetical protein
MTSRYPERMPPPAGAVSPNMRSALGRIAMIVVAIVVVVAVLALLKRSGPSPSEPFELPGTGVEPRP